jgi:hypothetical protein
MYQRTLEGFEKTLGPDHALTLSTARNLGILYEDVPASFNQLYTASSP